MKRMVQRFLGAIIIVAMLFSMSINYILQIRVSQKDMDASSKELFWQIQQILSQNQIELQQVTDDFANKCLLQARNVDYIIQSRPSLLEDQKEMEKVAALLEIDEFHIFDTRGKIYAGSEHKYFGYTFDSGEQMQYFLPMLTDQTLSMCQEITPNTAENKLMQYAAVWMEDGQGIVQVGLEPARVVEATKKNELSYIFSLLTADKGAVLYAADPETYEILGSTDKNLVGKYLTDIGLEPKHMLEKDKGTHVKIDGQQSYCIFTDFDSVLIGRSCSLDTLYQNVNQDTILLGLYLIVLSIVMIFGMSRYLDRKIIKGIDLVNSKLQNITDGNLDEQIGVHTTPEFTELSGYINVMVQSLLESTEKLSSVLDLVQIPVGVYEYNKSMKRVRVTKQIPYILALSDEEKKYLLSNHILFEEKLASIRQQPVDIEEDIYQLQSKTNRYIKMEHFLKNDSVFGILMDVTSTVLEKQRIEQERDEDILTGLLSRRALYAQMDTVFADIELLRHTAIIMIDADNLKQVNDNYGHEIGDRYLIGLADMLRSVEASKQSIARLSGDEFAVMFYGCNSAEELSDCIETLSRTREDYSIEISGKKHLPVSFSMGCAYYPQDGCEYHDLLKSADARMYEEKRRRKRSNL